VQGNGLVDSTGHAFLLRGTAMPFRQASDAAVLTASTFSQIGQRWNMNALRLQISVDMDAADPVGYIAQVQRIVHDANGQQLVVILAPHDENDTAGAPTQRMSPFWQKWAAAFRDQPMVMFDLYSQPVSTLIPGYLPGTHSPKDWAFWLHGGTAMDGSVSPGMQPLVDAVRSAAAQQVIVAMTLDENPLLQGFYSGDMLEDSNTVYEVCPLHADNQTDADRDQHYGLASQSIPVLANDWDLQLASNNAECQSIPSAPGAAEALIKADLQYFDSHAISWTSSFFTPGKLIKDDVNFFPTQLNTLWTCGGPTNPEPGMGEVLRYHLWGADDDAAITVNGAAGGLAIAPGSVAVVYGQPALTTATGLQAGTSVVLTDTAGRSRVAPLLYVAPSSINFVVPPDLKTGQIGVSVLNAGGPNLSGSLVALPVAPGLFSGTGDGRGAVVGFDLSTGALILTCGAASCSTIPIVASGPKPARIQLIATGLRGVSDPGKISVTIGGISVNVVSAGAFDEAMGTDQVVIEIGPEFTGLGEADLVLSAAGLVANCVRINVQ
jgi:uncharacterized protein (TIGR03437 family)